MFFQIKLLFFGYKIRLIFVVTLVDNTTLEIKLKNNVILKKNTLFLYTFYMIAKMTLNLKQKIQLYKQIILKLYDLRIRRNYEGTKIIFILHP